MFSRYKNNCCPYKSLLHAKPSASVNTAVHIGGVYATDKLRRVELYYREEVSNKQLYICILSDVSCKNTDNRKWNISLRLNPFGQVSCWLGVSAHLSSVIWDRTAQGFFLMTAWENKPCNWHSASILTKNTFSNILYVAAAKK